jgi:hypothetical protein
MKAKSLIRIPIQVESGIWIRSEVSDADPQFCKSRHFSISYGRMWAADPAPDTELL